MNEDEQILFIFSRNRLLLFNKARGKKKKVFFSTVCPLSDPTFKRRQQTRGVSDGGKRTRSTANLLSTFFFCSARCERLQHQARLLYAQCELRQEEPLNYSSLLIRIEASPFRLGSTSTAITRRCLSKRLQPKHPTHDWKGACPGPASDWPTSADNIQEENCRFL